MDKARERRELLENFHRLTRSERLSRVREFCQLSEHETQILSGEIPFPLEIAEHLIENVVGFFPLPMGVATNFCIDGKDVLIPMAVEETSIIAAASATAKWVSREGSIRTFMQGRLIIGQVQLPNVRNVAHAKRVLTEARAELVALANACIPGLVARGGGVREVVIRELDRPAFEKQPAGSMLVLHVLCDPCDAMGANLINQVCEALKPRIEQITDERVGLCILSNLTDGKLAVAEVVVRGIDPVVGQGIVEAALFAKVDPYRAATHNKGVLNGIDPILIATGNDWRAVEAGIHAYASRSGQYQPVTEWKMEKGDLLGRFEAPLAVGTVGGVTRAHPTARVALKMMGVERADDLARICATVGLVQNLGALKALSTVGIVKGHMGLHAANLAIAAGAGAHEIGEVRDRLNVVLEREKKINLSQAIAILEEIRKDAKEISPSIFN
ncbi:MAG: hydroxymethylglutaryl-CoA reductase, degradative [Cryobacterium sp.]|nr:hydroxymethylglutaryl-CoA reductase, degradative [Oligoflexia bacterium]